MGSFKKVAKTSDLSPGEMMLVEAGDERILPVNLDGEYYALSEVCPHAEAPLSEGFLEGEEVECPWHGSRFKVKTGEVTSPPAETPLARYEVRVEGEDILLGPRIS